MYENFSQEASELLFLFMKTSDFHSQYGMLKKVSYQSILLKYINRFKAPVSFDIKLRKYFTSLFVCLDILEATLNLRFCKAKFRINDTVQFLSYPLFYTFSP